MEVSYSYKHTVRAYSNLTFRIGNDEVFYDSVVMAVGLAATMPVKKIKIIFAGRQSNFMMGRYSAIHIADRICREWNRSRAINKGAK